MMGRNLKDVLKVLSGRINSNEFSAAMSASNPFEAEFDDDAYKQIEGQIKSLTTLDAAKNNQEVFEALKPAVRKEVESDIFKEAKAQTLFGVEKELGHVAKKFGIDGTGKKWNEIVSEIKNRADSLTGDVNETVTAQNKEIERLNKKVLNLTDARKTEKEEYENKLNGFQIDHFLRGEIEDKIKLAKPYQEKVVKEGLLSRFMDLAKSKSVPKLHEGTVKFMNPDNPEMELFTDSNKPAGLLDLIGQDAQPYIATAQDEPPKRHETPEAIDRQDATPGSPAAAMQQARRAMLNS